MLIFLHVYALSLSLWSIAFSRPPSCASNMCAHHHLASSSHPARHALHCQLSPSLSRSLSLSLPLPLSPQPIGAGGAATSTQSVCSLIWKSLSTQQCHATRVVVEGRKDIRTDKTFSFPLDTAVARERKVTVPRAPGKSISGKFPTIQDNLSDTQGNITPSKTTCFPRTLCSKQGKRYTLRVEPFLDIVRL